MKMRIIAVVGAGCVLAGCSTYSSAPPVRGTATVSVGAVASVSLSTEQERLVREHFAGSSAGTDGNGNGRGRGRAGGLPPGIEKNLARGKPLPPGIARQYLPSSLTGRLPVLPSGFDYLVAAGKLLVVEAATQMVREVLLDAIA